MTCKAVSNADPGVKDDDIACMGCNGCNGYKCVGRRGSLGGTWLSVIDGSVDNKGIDGSSVSSVVGEADGAADTDSDAGVGADSDAGAAVDRSE